VRDGLIFFDVKKSNTKAIPVGTKYRNEILKLEQNVFITRNDKKLVTEFVRGQATVRTKQKY
jgi:hypothetical protein